MLHKSQFSMVVTLIISLFCSIALAQVPQVINYQGMLTDAGGTALSGSFTIQFKIYDAPTAGNVLWTETQTVTVTAGLFDVLLGSVTAIPYSVFDGKDKFLSLKVGSDPEMTPRKRLVSVGYSFRAYNADKVDGKDASAFVEVGQANAITTPMIQDNAVTAAKIAPNVVSSLNGVSNDGGNIDLVAGSNITITPDDANNKITIAATGTGGIGGSGTPDYLSKFTGTSAIGNSIILEKNNGLAIGTATPDANCMLTIEGTQNRPNGLIAIGHFGSTSARPAGIYAGLKSTSAALTGAGIYAKVLATENPNIGYLYGAQFGAVADATKPCRGVSIGLEGNQISSDDYALELLAVDPGYALYCRDNGKAYFGGNVGIGTTNPQDKLEIANGNLRFYNSADNKTHVFSYDAAGDYFFFDELGVGRHLTIKNGGNIGIGTTNPSHKLHVVAQDAVGLFESTGSLAFLRLTTREGINNRIELKNNPGGMLSLWTAGTGAGDVLNITRDGNVGIGTTTPSYKLDVNGATQITAKGDDATILMLNCERPFAFRQRGTGFAAGLDLRPNVDAKLISISASDKKILGGFYDEAGTTPDKVYFVPDGGYVGIGLSSPTRIFQIRQGAGRAIADGWDVYSSRRWKSNIQPIQGALDKVKRLTGVLFDWKDSGKHDLGLIAEDVGQVIPEVVSYEENGIDAQSVDYARLVAILIQGMKEQQMTIEQLTKRIDELEKKKR